MADRQISVVSNVYSNSSCLATNPKSFFPLGEGVKVNIEAGQGNSCYHGNVVACNDGSRGGK
jgi:hypothetical protein